MRKLAVVAIVVLAACGSARTSTPATVDPAVATQLSVLQARIDRLEICADRAASGTTATSNDYFPPVTSCR